MSRSLPLRANLEWLRKEARERLEALRAGDRPTAALNDAQRELAQEYGFASWAKLKAHVEEHRRKLDALVRPEALRTAAVAADDPELSRVLAAVRAGETGVVAELVARRPALVKAAGPHGFTALHVAAQCNDPQLAALLVAYGADLEARIGGGSGHTALSWAVTCNAQECARALVRLGARLDLFCAAGMGLLDEVRGFFDGRGELVAGASGTGTTRIGADGARLPCPPETAREQVSDALGMACRNGRVEVVRWLLGREVDVEFRGYAGARPLHWAYFGGSGEVVELLAAAGADPGARDELLGCTPRAFGICAPAAWGMAWLVRARLAADPGLAQLMDGRTSALHEAARGGQVEVVRLLLGHGADAGLRDGGGRTALEVAAAAGQAAAVEVLRGAGGSSAEG